MVLEFGAAPLDRSKELPVKDGLVDKTQSEIMLESRELSGVSKLIGGSNKVEKVELKDDGSVIFKSKKGECNFSHSGYEKGSLYKRERGAYLIDRFLGFNLVPPTVIRQIDGEIGSAQEFIDAKTAIETANEDRLRVSDFERGKLRLFDDIIWQTDRFDNNFLIEIDKIWAIDNGCSFAVYAFDDGIKNHGDTFLLAADIISNIKNFLGNDELKIALRGLLAECLTQQEIDACFARIKKIGEVIIREECIPKDFILEFNPSK